MFLTFSNSVLLIGLAGAAVPLVLHLLSRARYQGVEWGAMLFLEGIEPRQRHSARISQALLLVVRTAVVALLAVALAQPILLAEQPGEAQASGGTRPRVDAAILLDCSPGMNFEENGHSRFSLAQSAAKQVLAGLHRGDRVSLVLLGRHQGDRELEPTADLQGVADRIDAAQTGDESADVTQGLVQAQEALDREGRAARDLYIVSDRRAMTWRNVNDYFMTRRWPELLRTSNASPRIFVVPVGNSDADNVAVESAELGNPPAIIGQDAQIEVALRNYGPTARAAVPLTVSVNGRVAFTTTLSVPGHDATRVAVPISGKLFAAAGPQVIAAEIKTVGFRDDDRLDAVVDAIDPISVLVVSGDERDDKFGAFRGESDFLRVALSPLHALHRKGADPCKVDVATEDQWPQLELSHYKVVVLANIERFSDAQTRAIEQYVYGGGGLLVAPGGLSRPDNYNEQLWRDGAGILPAQMEDPTSADGSEATTIVGYDPTTPIFRFLHERPDLMVSSTIGRYFPTDLRPSDAQVLAWYTSGAPFLIESRAGKGKVLLMTTSLDADWSTLPLSSFYLPFVQSAVRYLAAGTLPARNLDINQPIEMTFDEPVEDRATIALPDGQQQQLSLPHFGATSEFHFGNTRQPGIYRVRVKGRDGQKVFAFAVHLPHDQSDLTQLTAQRWAELESGLHLRRIDAPERPIATVVAGARDGVDLWPWALGAVLVMATIELSLAKQWSKDAY